MTREDALAHFGVKGMRWGVRNSTKSTGKETKEIVSTTYHKGKVVAVTKSKGPYPTTDAERKAFIEDFAKRQNEAQQKRRRGQIAVRALVVAGVLATRTVDLVVNGEFNTEPLPPITGV
jgi:hypothetical protein